MKCIAVYIFCSILDITWCWRVVMNHSQFSDSNYSLLCKVFQHDKLVMQCRVSMKTWDLAKQSNVHRMDPQAQKLAMQCRMSTQDSGSSSSSEHEHKGSRGSSENEHRCSRSSGSHRRWVQRRKEQWCDKTSIARHQLQVELSLCLCGHDGSVSEERGCCITCLFKDSILPYLAALDWQTANRTDVERQNIWWVFLS